MWLCSQGPAQGAAGQARCNSSSWPGLWQGWGIPTAASHCWIWGQSRHFGCRRDQLQGACVPPVSARGPQDPASRCGEQRPHARPMGLLSVLQPRGREVPVPAHPARSISRPAPRQWLAAAATLCKSPSVRARGESRGRGSRGRCYCLLRHHSRAPRCSPLLNGALTLAAAGRPGSVPAPRPGERRGGAALPAVPGSAGPWPPAHQIRQLPPPPRRARGSGLRAGARGRQGGGPPFPKASGAALLNTFGKSGAGSLRSRLTPAARCPRRAQGTAQRRTMAAPARGGGCSAGGGQHGQAPPSPSLMAGLRFCRCLPAPCCPTPPKPRGWWPRRDARGHGRASCPGALLAAPSVPADPHPCAGAVMGGGVLLAGALGGVSSRGPSSPPAHGAGPAAAPCFAYVGREHPGPTPGPVLKPSGSSSRRHWDPAVPAPLAACPPLPAGPGTAWLLPVPVLSPFPPSAEPSRVRESGCIVLGFPLQSPQAAQGCAQSHTARSVPPL